MHHLTFVCTSVNVLIGTGRTHTGERGLPITIPIVYKKVVQLHNKMYDEESSFFVWTVWVQDGNEGSARGTEYTTCPLKVRNYLPIQKQVQLSSHLSMNLLKSTSLLSIKFSIVMRLDLTFACCRTRH